MDMTKEISCEECAAMCCRYVATQLDEPTTRRDYDNMRWYLLHRDVHVFRDHDGDWFLEFEGNCESLGADNRCHSYTERPRICRDHGVGKVDCEFHGATEPHDIRFSDVREFERWLDDQGIKWRKKRAKRVAPEAAKPTTVPRK